MPPILTSTSGSLQLVTLHVSSCPTVTSNAKAQWSPSSLTDASWFPKKLAPYLTESRRWLVLPLDSYSLSSWKRKEKWPYLPHVAYFFPFALPGLVILSAFSHFHGATPNRRRECHTCSRRATASHSRALSKTASNVIFPLPELVACSLRRVIRQNEW